MEKLINNNANNKQIANELIIVFPEFLDNDIIKNENCLQVFMVLCQLRSLKLTTREWTNADEYSFNTFLENYADLKLLFSELVKEKLHPKIKVNDKFPDFGEFISNAKKV